MSHALPGLAWVEGAHAAQLTWQVALQMIQLTLAHHERLGKCPHGVAEAHIANEPAFLSRAIPAAAHQYFVLVLA
jgi:hypothetical protein